MESDIKKEIQRATTCIVICVIMMAVFNTVASRDLKNRLIEIDKKKN
jgi:hypothetical protein